jgi:hypothetical protein
MTNAWKAPLKLAVVGHTNVGKTSLLRTLTRDVGFGDVSHRPSTTRHVEGARLSVDGEPLLDLYDTPGLEDAIALLDYLERLERPGERLDGPARLARFLDGSEARQRFEQEAKVLRQLLASDAGLYVIDAREPVLAKYRDELEVLASCGKPLLPVLNFVSSANHREPDAELLIDCAACRRSVVSDAEQEQQAISELRKAVRQREQRCVEGLLKLYAFRPQDAAASELPLLDGRWGDDLFNPETLKQLGVRVGGGIAAGAAAGAGVDLLVGGLTLGAAALAGAIAGGALQTARSYGSRLMGKIRGQRELTVDDSVLRLLALRQRQLLQALNARGHAAMDSIQVATPQDKTWREGKLPEALNKARAHPQWSSLNPQAKLSQAERQEQVEVLAQQL